MAGNLFAAPEIDCPICGRIARFWAPPAWLDPPRFALQRLLARWQHRVLPAHLHCPHCHTRFVDAWELPRIVVGYHGCHRDFAHGLVRGRISLAEWQASRNDYDWLGEGIYFWEHAPGRAWQWARERHGAEGAVVAAEIALGRCLDLSDIDFVDLLRESYEDTVRVYGERGAPLPANSGREFKLRRLDRAVLDRLTTATDPPGGLGFQTVRCPFEEGAPVYPGAMIRTQSHIQIAVRDRACLRLPLIFLSPREV
jgi:hypothetical protein